MAIKITAVLCEGPHDVAFITKILKAIGFAYNENLKLGQFPSPISSLLVAEAKKSNIEDLNLQELRQALLPMNTMRKEDTYLFLYSLGGDKKKEARAKIIKDFYSFIPKSGEINKLMPDNTELAIVYFFDADNDGVELRLKYINDELNELIGASPFASHGEFKDVESIKFGSYIFTGNDNKTGKLEDILLPLMKNQNEQIFDDAKSYLEKYYTSTRGKAGDYDLKKSKIGIAGQLQKSGSTNTVVIAQTDYLTPAKITSNVKCNEIIDFFNLL